MTNGIVSILKDGKVILKAVAGCNGYPAADVAKAVRKSPGLSVPMLYAICRECDFGCEDCLVVQDVQTHKFAGDDELGPLYKAEFSNPRFNPRWVKGTAEYTEIVEL